jgi:hypothetical protein
MPQPAMQQNSQLMRGQNRPRLAAEALEVMEAGPLVLLVASLNASASRD